jgi:hypothetical protein
MYHLVSMRPSVRLCTSRLKLCSSRACSGGRRGHHRSTAPTRSPTVAADAMGPLARFLADDHARLDRLLGAAAGDRSAYEQLRAGLLRHIAMEEKVLLPAAKRLRNGAPVERADILRADHSALAALLVPTPTPAILDRARTLLAQHNPLEEGPDGVYAAVEALAGDGAEALLARLQAVPAVPVAAHFDGPRAFDSIDRLLRRALELRTTARR